MREEGVKKTSNLKLQTWNLKLFGSMMRDEEICTVDPRVRTFVRPSRVLWAVGATDAETLLGPRHGQVPEGAFYAGSGCLLETDGIKPAAILLDFGRELHGGLQLGCGGRSDRGMKVRVRFGESASEAMSELGEKSSGNDHAIRDGVIDVPWLGTREIGMTGFRFVRIDLVTRGKLMLEFVRAVSLMRPMKQIGAFKCSDERLTKIWETAVRTVHLCCQEHIWDGIKRDRLVWQGDMHPEVAAILSVFGGDSVVTASLDYMVATTPAGHWMNNKPSYTMWWLMCLRDYWRATADRAYLERHLDYLKSTVSQLVSCVNDDGSWLFPNGEQGFLDWPTQHNQPAVMAGMRGLYVWSLGAAIELFEALGERAAVAPCRKAITRLRKVKSSPEGAKSAAALLTLGGVRSARRMFDEVLGRGGVKGVSTFYGYYMLEAMSVAGEDAFALKTVRDYWGGMLDAGATSFWEDFNIDWLKDSYRIDELPVPGKKDIHGDFGEFCYCGFRHSLCHGWSSGPATWLIRHVLGIRILEPGGAKVEVRPFLGELDWAEGALAVPGGAVRVTVKRGKDGVPEVRVRAPKGVTIEGV